MYKSFTYPFNRDVNTLDGLLDEPMMIGFSSAEEWQIAPFNSLYSPRKSINKIDVYIPVQTRQLVSRVLSGDITVSDKSYVAALIDDPNLNILIEASLRHDYFLTPILRVLGVYTNIVYNQGVATDKDHYLADEITGECIFIQTFKPLYRKPNTTQAVKIVFSLSLGQDDGWFADDIHWVNDTDFIY